MPPLVILLGVVTAWSGWQGLSVAEVIRDAGAGRALPQYSQGGGFISIVALPLEIAGAIASALGTAIANGIKGVVSGGLGGIFGTILGGLGDALPFLSSDTQPA